MSMTNCVNCGAAKEISDLQCPFCGTKYADLTTLELFSDKPMFVQLKGRDGHVITAKAYVTNTTLNMQPETVSMRDVSGRIHRRVVSTHVSGTIDFSLYETMFE